MAMTFIDLKNVFGSISHQYIHDLLPYVKVPTEIRYYIHMLTQQGAEELLYALSLKYLCRFVVTYPLAEFLTKCS